MMSAKERIARRAAKELPDGGVVNLGIGLPTLVSDYVPENIKMILQSENGMLGTGSIVNGGEYDPNLVNAGGTPVHALPGSCCFDSCMSFTIIRGGHVDVTILGALQVDESGSLASHIIPGKMVSGMGGAMDLVTGSRKVIVTMTHRAKDGTPKILEQLTLPVTAVSKVDMIITELAVIEVTESGLLLKEAAEDVSVDEIICSTGAKLIIDAELKSF